MWPLRLTSRSADSRAPTAAATAVPHVNSPSPQTRAERSARPNQSVTERNQSRLTDRANGAERVGVDAQSRLDLLDEVDVEAEPPQPETQLSAAHAPPPLQGLLARAPATTTTLICGPASRHDNGQPTPRRIEQPGSTLSESKYSVGDLRAAGRAGVVAVDRLDPAAASSSVEKAAVPRRSGSGPGSPVSCASTGRPLAR